MTVHFFGDADESYCPASGQWVTQYVARPLDGPPPDPARTMLAELAANCLILGRVPALPFALLIEPGREAMLDREQRLGIRAIAAEHGPQRIRVCSLAASTREVSLDSLRQGWFLVSDLGDSAAVHGQAEAEARSYGLSDDAILTLLATSGLADVRRYPIYNASPATVAEIERGPVAALTRGEVAVALWTAAEPL